MVSKEQLKKYIGIKNIGYKFYEFFSVLNETQKKEFIKNIEDLQNLDSYYSKILINTLIYPHDVFLSSTLKNNSAKLGKELVEKKYLKQSTLNDKRLEYGFFNFNNIYESGVFSSINFADFPVSLTNKNIKFEENQIKK